MRTDYVVMARHSFLAFVVAASLSVFLGAKGQEWVLLPGHLADELTRQCSRPAPDDFEATWEPSTSDVQRLEQRIDQIETLKAKECCLRNARVDDVHDYYRQYVGIVLDGRKVIYINAFKRDVECTGWRDSTIVYCDGGKTFWGVVFDPKTGVFSGLAFNGEV